MRGTIAFIMGIILVAVIVGGDHCQVSEPASDSPLGIAFGEGSTNLDHFMDYIHDLGVKRTKVSFYWSQLEPRPGEYDFHVLDQYLHQLGPDDWALLNLFTDGWCADPSSNETPKGRTFFACPYGRSGCSQPCQEYYRGFIRTLAEHVKENARGGIKYWQRDTEPASPRHYPADKPEEYVEAQRIFYETVKSVLPEALVVGVSHNGSFTKSGQPSSADFFDYVIHYAQDDFDLLDIRLYKDKHTIPYRVEWFRDRMKLYGYKKPIVSTEQGGPDPWTLYDDGRNLYAEFKAKVERDCAGSPVPWQCLHRWIGEHFQQISPKLQVFLWPADAAQNEKYERMHCHDIVQRNVIMLASGVEEMWWWNLQSDGYHPVFGKMRLMTENYEKLPGYPCYKRMVERLGDVSSVERVDLDDESIYFYKVIKASSDVPLYVVWHRDKEVDPYDAEGAPPVGATLQVGFDGVKITDAFGGEEVRVTDDSVLTLAVDDTPRYLEEAEGTGAGR